MQAASKGIGIEHGNRIGAKTDIVSWSDKSVVRGESPFKPDLGWRSIGIDGRAGTGGGGPVADDDRWRGRAERVIGALGGPDFVSYEQSEVVGRSRVYGDLEWISDDRLALVVGCGLDIGETIVRGRSPE